MNLKISGDNLTIMAVLAVLVIFFTVLFGIIGLRTSLGIIALFFVPFYFILSMFDLSVGEKVVFALFIGLGIFPTISYLLAFVFSSIKISIAVSFVLLIITGVVLNGLKR